MNYKFTSESVSMGHPDKICDQISDAILDACLSQDPDSRVACESGVKDHKVVVFGEITTKAKINVYQIVKEAVKKAGYHENEQKFWHEGLEIINWIGQQSPDISQGVTEGEGLYKEQGAGDQGMMFGYACNETEELMPLPITLAHRLTERLAKARENKEIEYIRPDGKSQVTVDYENGKPKRIDTVLIGIQHKENTPYEKIKEDMIHLAKSVIPSNLIDENTKFLVNPTGKFIIGGPEGDAGLTGRKIIVDTYGGMGRHGGGAFSGKDPSKVDRSAAYAARYIAKNIVAAGLAEKCEVQLAYAIGVAEPISIHVDTFNTGKIPEEKIIELIRKHFPIKPKDIIEHFKLKTPEGWCYKDTAVHGHFGRKEFPWEKIDKVDLLKIN